MRRLSHLVDLTLLRPWMTHLIDRGTFQNNQPDIKTCLDLFLKQTPQQTDVKIIPAIIPTENKRAV